MEFTQQDQLRMQKAARRKVEIEREIPRFKNKVHVSKKDRKKPKHKKMQFNLVDSY
jgi:hypothetical protein